MQTTMPTPVRLNQLPVLAKQLIDTAALPSLYVEAKQSLMKLDRVDEIKDFSDKHSAIAHYAKQVKDDGLRFYAERVYLRALRRMGELLSEFPKAGRTKRWKEMGVEKDAHIGMTLARISKSDFEAAVEQSPPPTKNSLIWNQRRKERPSENTQSDVDVVWSPAEEMLKTISVLGSGIEAEKSVPLGALWLMSPPQLLWGKGISSEDARLLRERLQRIIEYFDDIDNVLRKLEGRK